MNFVTIDSDKGRHVLGAGATEGYAVLRTEDECVTALPVELKVPRFAFLKILERLIFTNNKAAAVYLLHSATGWDIVCCREYCEEFAVSRYDPRYDSTLYARCPCCAEALKTYK